MKELENLKELYLDEIKKINKKGDLTPADSEAACKALDAIKKIDEICGEMSPEMEYSQRMYPNRMSRMPEMSYGYSDRRGRNMHNGQYISRNDYSTHDDVYYALDKLESMRMEAPDERTRRAIDLAIDELHRR